MDINKVIEFLKGKKTYGIVAAGLGLWACAHLGWIAIDPAVLKEYETAIMLAAIATLRAAVGPSK